MLNFGTLQRVFSLISGEVTISPRRETFKVTISKTIVAHRRYCIRFQSQSLFFQSLFSIVRYTARMNKMVLKIKAIPMTCTRLLMIPLMVNYLWWPVSNIVLGVSDGNFQCTCDIYDSWDWGKIHACLERLDYVPQTHLENDTIEHDMTIVRFAGATDAIPPPIACTVRDIES